MASSGLPSLELDSVNADFCRSFACTVAWAHIAMTMKGETATRDIFATLPGSP